MINKVLFIFLIALLFLYGQSEGFEVGNTHPEITEMGASKSILRTFLADNLGFKDGLATLFPSKDGRNVLSWLRKGSIEEDSPDCRASHHFHNPTLPWDQSGMSDEPFWTDLGCWKWRPYSSNVTWATGLTSRTGSPMPRPGQEMGWDNARESYRNGILFCALANPGEYLASIIQSPDEMICLV